MNGWLDHLPVRVKAFAASAVLLLCLAFLGLNAFLTLGTWANGLEHLSRAVMSEQKQLSVLDSELSAIQLNLFRYVAWSSNGVDDQLRQKLQSNISAGLDLVSVKLQHWPERALTSDDAQWAQLSQEWKKFAKAVQDTIEIARVDPAMGTMMLGATDDDFVEVANTVKEFSRAIDRRTQAAADELVEQAEAQKRVIGLGGLLATLLSLLTAILVARSIITPIRAVTSAMTDVSLGKSQGAPGGGERRDEIGQMVRAISAFREMINRNNALLNEREQELRTQNTRFETAINNMTQGLAMFDADRKLIVCNKRYAEIYTIPSELIRNGTTAEQILHYRLEQGLYKDRSFGSLAERASKERTAHVNQIELADGRTIIVSHQPMLEGGWVSTHEDVTERRRADAQIEHMARHDALTDLPNRALFRERLEGALARTQRGETIAVLCLDIDHFKNINDTLGHLIGDALLRSVSARLLACVRNVDTVARLSGDEFAIIQVALERVDEATVLAERIVAAMAEPFDLDDHRVAVTTSIGVSIGPGHGIDADRLLKSADTALYRAKNEGRGTYRCFEPEMDKRLRVRQATEVTLRSALANAELSLHYQPIINIRNNQIAGFEALLRWYHPVRGLISPADFIPLAEEMGVIVPIGEWVLREACSEATNWPTDCIVAVNVSPAQFRSPNLVATVISALARSKLAPRRLELEITETVLLDSSETTMATLNQLRSLGVRISLDDFGVGYSSLSYLQKFPFDKIKLDGSFVRNLAVKSETLAIVRAVAGLGRNLGMITTAECVETQEQLELITAEGCDEVQGFYFGAAKPAQEITAFIAEFRDKVAA